jgi:predicted nucleotidyltransferase
VSPSPFSSDITEFLSLLSAHGVRYLIVGGEAVIYYGYARLTGDVDIFYEASAENAAALFAALLEFWNGEVPGVGAARELLEPGLILQFGVPPNRIDLLNRIDGVSFPECWGPRKEVDLSLRGRRFPVNYIGRQQLIKNKEAARRDKDLDDLRFLRRLT